jgi:hypothetical protein
MSEIGTKMLYWILPSSILIGWMRSVEKPFDENASATSKSAKVAVFLIVESGVARKHLAKNRNFHRGLDTHGRKCLDYSSGLEASARSEGRKTKRLKFSRRS